MNTGTIGRFVVRRTAALASRPEAVDVEDVRLGRLLLALPIAGPGEAAEERLRRLARLRAAAALSHPAFPEILEVVETPEADWMITRRIEGRPAASGVPLDVGATARIGEDLALALQDAERCGLRLPILHPHDLAISSDGAVRISVEAMAETITGERPPGPPPLVLLGRLLVELSTASPAAGDDPEGRLPQELRDIVHRALRRDDPLAFGQPREAAAALHAVRRSVSRSALRPAVARSRRRAPALLLLGALAAVVAVLALVGLLGRSPWLVVAVAPPVAEVAVDEPLVATAAAESVISRLTRMERVAVVPPVRVAQALAAGASRSRELAARLGADVVVNVAITQSGAGGPLRIVVTRVDAATGHLTWSGQDDATASPTSVRETAGALASAAFAERGTAPAFAPPITAADPLQPYLTAWRLTNGSAVRLPVEAARVLHDAEGIPSASADVQVLLAQASILAFDVSGGPEALDTADAALRRLAGVAPEDPRLLRWSAELALRRGDPAHAVELGRRLTARRTGDPRAWETFSAALAASGSPGEAARARRRAGPSLVEPESGRGRSAGDGEHRPGPG